MDKKIELPQPRIYILMKETSDKAGTSEIIGAFLTKEMAERHANKNIRQSRSFVKEVAVLFD